MSRNDILQELRLRHFTPASYFVETLKKYRTDLKDIFPPRWPE